GWVPDYDRAAGKSDRIGRLGADAGPSAIREAAPGPPGRDLIVPVDGGVAAEHIGATGRQRSRRAERQRLDADQEPEPLARAAAPDAPGEAHVVLRRHVDEVQLLVELEERAAVAPSLARRRLRVDDHRARRWRVRRERIQRGVGGAVLVPVADDVVDPLLRHAQRYE